MRRVTRVVDGGHAGRGSAVLQAYTGGPIEVKGVRGTWISVDDTGSLEKQTWLEFSKVIAYRTER